MQTTFVVIFIVCVVAGVAWAPWRAMIEQWTMASSLVLGVGLILTSAVPLAKFTGNFQTTFSQYGVPTYSIDGYAAQLQSNASLVLAIFLAMMVLYWLIFRRNTDVQISLLLLLLLPVTSAFVAAYNGDGFWTTRILIVILLLLVLPLGPRGIGASIGAATYGICLLVASAALAAFSPYEAFGQSFECTRKCGSGSLVFSGALQHENQLGLALLMASPFIIIVTRRWSRFFFALAFGLAIFATGSRTAYLALAVGALYMVCVLLSRRARHIGQVQGKLQRRIGGLHHSVKTLFLSAGIGAAVLVPLLTTSEEAFTNRGLLWQLAERGIANSFWFGNGSTGWSSLFASGAFSSQAAYSAHNQVIDLLYNSGVFGLAIFAGVVATKWRNAASQNDPLISLPLIILAWTGILEAPVSLIQPNWLTWALPALLLSIPEASKPLVEHTPTTPIRAGVSA